MSKAFVLINCELGTEEQIISELKKMDCVKEVYGTFGAYDILANLECDNFETLRQLIIGEIRKIKNIRTTSTLMGVDGRIRWVGHGNTNMQRLWIWLWF